MKTKTPLAILTTALLGCLPALAQEAPPPPPGGPPLAPPRGEQPRPPRPPGVRDEHETPAPPDGQGRPGERGREGEGRPGGPRENRGPREEHGARDGEGPRGGHGDNPREGARRGPGEEHGPGAEHRPEASREAQPFLGVSAAPVPPPLAAQLGLQEGFGLLVAEVLPESPASQAGVQRFDVLKLLNDQQLIDPQQLAALVRGAGKGKEVALTVIRKAQEQKITVTVGEHTPPAGGPGPLGFSPETIHERIREMEERGHGMQDRAREFQDRARQMQEHFREPHGPPAPREPGDRPPRQSGGPEAGAPGTAAVAPEELLREAQPGGGGQIRVMSEAGVTTLEGAQSRLQLKDADGEIEVAGDHGRRTLTARNPQGTVVFTGPVDTAAQRAAVPENYRNKLAEIHVRAQAEEPAEAR